MNVMDGSILQSSKTDSLLNWRRFVNIGFDVDP